METFKCPKCGKASYSASRDISRICPYCDVEKLLVFNPAVMAMSHELSNAKIIIDRRLSSLSVDDDRRNNVDMIPVAWLVLKQKEISKKLS